MKRTGGGHSEAREGNDVRSVCEHTPPPAKRFAQISPLDFVSRGLFSIKISRNLKCSEGSVVESRFQKSWSRPRQNLKAARSSTQTT